MLKNWQSLHSVRKRFLSLSLRVDARIVWGWGVNASEAIWCSQNESTGENHQCLLPVQKNRLFAAERKVYVAKWLKLTSYTWTFDQNFIPILLDPSVEVTVFSAAIGHVRSLFGSPRHSNDFLSEAIKVGTGGHRQDYSKSQKGTKFHKKNI